MSCRKSSGAAKGRLGPKTIEVKLFRLNRRVKKALYDVQRECLSLHDEVISPAVDMSRLLPNDARRFLILCATCDVAFWASNPNSLGAESFCVGLSVTAPVGSILFLSFSETTSRTNFSPNLSLSVRNWHVTFWSVSMKTKW